MAAQMASQYQQIILPPDILTRSTNRYQHPHVATIKYLLRVFLDLQKKEKSLGKIDKASNLANWLRAKLLVEEAKIRLHYAIQNVANIVS